MKRAVLPLLALLLCTPVRAQTTVPEAGPAPEEAPGRINRRVDPEAYSIVSSARGITAHKATFVYPATFSDEFHGPRTEMIFQFSGKWRVFGSDAYLAYTQKSFWQWINSDQSSPFRETNYNPEVFYRWIPTAHLFNHWALDAGFEHESNGKGYTPPDAAGRPTSLSRSWNRLYLAPLFACLALGTALAAGHWQRVLANPVLLFLSAISYNLYLWHADIAAAIRDNGWWPAATPVPMDDPHWRWSYTLVSFAASVTVATLLTYAVERPLLRLGVRGAARAVRARLTPR